MRHSIQGYVLGLALVGAGLMAFATSRVAAAEDNPMSAYYGNTLTCQGGADDNWLCYDWYYPGGYVRELQVIRRRDGFIAIHGRQGTFKVMKKAGQPVVCQTLDGGAHEWCRQLAHHVVGDRWEETLANGHKQVFSIKEGRNLLNFMSGSGKDTHILAPYHYPDYPPNPNRAIKDVGGAASG